MLDRADLCVRLWHELLRLSLIHRAGTTSEEGRSAVRPIEVTREYAPSEGLRPRHADTQGGRYSARNSTFARRPWGETESHRPTVHRSQPEFVEPYEPAAHPEVRGGGKRQVQLHVGAGLVEAHRFR